MRSQLFLRPLIPRMICNRLFFIYSSSEFDKKHFRSLLSDRFSNQTLMTDYSHITMLWVTIQLRPSPSYKETNTTNYSNTHWIDQIKKVNCEGSSIPIKKHNKKMSCIWQTSVFKLWRESMPIHIAKENVGQHLKEAFSKCWQSDKTKNEKKNIENHLPTSTTRYLSGRLSSVSQKHTTTVNLKCLSFLLPSTRPLRHECRLVYSSYLDIERKFSLETCRVNDHRCCRLSWQRVHQRYELAPPLKI
jgi:hypothetical protein